MQKGFKILLVEDIESFRASVSQLLGVYNDVSEAGSLAHARDQLRFGQFDLVLLDRGLPDGDGLSLVQEIKSENPKTMVIALTSDDDMGSVKHALNLGCDDYLIKSPNVVPELLVRIPMVAANVAERLRLKSLQAQMSEAFKYELIGKSASTANLREQVLSLRGMSSPVLVLGETGTGKELIARRLNSVENDPKRPFVAVNCGAVQPSLIESELFGHVKGAFTGATSDKLGKFELADGGDIFLDEIGDLPLSAQASLLRALQEKEIQRVGATKTIKVDCRVIAATHKDLSHLVSKGAFREDLFHRLNVIRITTAPLRERREDIADLVKNFVLQIGGPKLRIEEQAISVMKRYDWPGNVRELRNATERAVLAARIRKSNSICSDDVEVHEVDVSSKTRAQKLEAALPRVEQELTPSAYGEFLLIAEREYLRSALEAVGWSVADLGVRLGVPRSTIFRRIKELGIEKPSRRSLSREETHSRLTGGFQ